MSAQVFSPIHNMLARLSLILVIGGVVGVLGFLDLYHRSPYVRYTNVSATQPVPFSHKHHANLGIDCRYCHTSVEDSSFANIPPTKTCMNCHNVMWNEAPMLEPIRDSWANKEPLEWNRVHDLPDFVYFDHSIHVNKGIGCSTCHGEVDKMPLIRKEHALFMKWCLDCHRDPANFIRPREEITNMDFDPHSLSREDREELVAKYHVDTKAHRLTNCSICHR